MALLNERCVYAVTVKFLLKKIVCKTMNLLLVALEPLTESGLRAIGQQQGCERD